jgi:Zn-dependent peptidase ImmA (M78 family)
MKLRRGFRKEAEEYAEEFRNELALEVDGPLCPFKLAEHLEIPIVPLSKLDDLDESHLDYIRHKDTSLFSATTVAEGTFKLVVHNDNHSASRQNSNIMHELSHILLGHPLRPPLAEDGCRNFDRVSETEANQLGFTLLVPRKAALRIIESGMGMMKACQIYGVSNSLLRARINISGVKGWADNRRKNRLAAE